jgi:hypothetical protein
MFYPKRPLSIAERDITDRHKREGNGRAGVKGLGAASLVYLRLYPRKIFDVVPQNICGNAASLPVVDALNCIAEISCDLGRAA